MSYQLRPNDPLIDTEQCKRDIKLMSELGVNCIRVYHVDPKADHDGCMNAFDEAGIYVTVDMDTFNTFILPVSLDGSTGPHRCATARCCFPELPAPYLSDPNPPGT